MNTRSMDEWELLQGINAGHKDAIWKFHRSIIKALCKIAYDIVKDRFEAENLAWEAFLAMIEKPKKFDTLQDAKNYVYRATKNKSLNFIRIHKYKNRPSLHTGLPDLRDDRDLEALIHKAEILKEMLARVKKLPAKYQLILLLFANDKETREIAAAVREDNQYVLNRKNKLLKKLRKLLKQQGLLFIFL